jgi:hypothetical protein
LARKTVFVSDLSGNEIADPAKVTITYQDSRKGSVVIDVDANEIADLASKGIQHKRRGRRPKVEA